MPSPERKKARRASSTFSVGLPVVAAMRPARREDRRALVRFRGATDAKGRLAGAGELTQGSWGNDFDRNSALRDKDMPSLICLPCLVFVWTSPRNGDMGRAFPRARRAIARSAEGEPRRPQAAGRFPTSAAAPDGPMRREDASTRRSPAATNPRSAGPARRSCGDPCFRRARPPGNAACS
jgi:hypothetical protein